MTTNWHYPPEMPEEGEAVFAEVGNDSMEIYVPIQLTSDKR